jgi:putative phage-type endonuclease
MKRICNTSNREAWLENRRAGIGASDAPAVLGVGMFGRSPITVYADKVAPESETRDNEAMWWGRELEPLIISRAKQLGLDEHIVHDGCMYHHDQRHWQMATFDALIRDERRKDVIPVEVKFVPMRESAWDDGVPADCLVQVRHQISVADAPFGYIVALLCNPVRFVWQKIERDMEFEQEILLPAEEEFWQRVVERDPPDSEGCAQTNAALKRLYPKDNGETIELTELELNAWDLMKALKEEAKVLDAGIQASEHLIKRALGEAQAGVLPDGRTLTLNTTTRGGYTVEPTTYRTLRQKKKA